MSQLKYPFQLGLPELPATAGSEVKPFLLEDDLRYAYNAIHNLAASVATQCGLQAPAAGYQNIAQAAVTIGNSKKRIYVPSSVAITYGQLVNLWDNAGTLEAQLADATTAATPAHGICNTVGTSGIGDMLEILLPSCHLTSIGGMNQGDMYFLSTTPGAVQNTPPAVAGNIVQAVGVALAADSMFFNLSYQYSVA